MESAGQAAATADDKPGILVPEHFVPTPTTISAEAQAILSRELPDFGVTLPKLGDPPEVWQAFKDIGNNGLVMMTKRYATLYPAEVVTHELSQFSVYEITPHDTAPENTGRAIVFIHGGGFINGGGEGAIYCAMQFAGLARCKTYSIDYRMVPDFCYPVPVDDCLEAYRFVLERHEPGKIGLFGPSAGANLVAAVALKARDLGLPLPGACAMHSVPSDIGMWGDTGHTNFMVDIILKKMMPELSEAYANGQDTSDPYMSPVHGNYAKGFPPSILVSGTRDLLLSDTVRLHQAMIKGGADVDLLVFEAMGHMPFIDAPEEADMYSQIIAFLFKHMKA